jgi:hypothetical protein
MLTPDLSLLKKEIGLADGEDFPWVHDLHLSPNRHGGGYYATLGGGAKNYCSVKWLRSLLHLSRLDRKIDQRKKSIP